MGSFNDRIRQILVLFILLLLVYLVIVELYIFLPGLLGALTIYILSRGQYFQLVYNRKWKKRQGSGAVHYLLPAPAWYPDLPEHYAHQPKSECFPGKPKCDAGNS